MSASTQIIGPSILNSLDLGMWTTRMNGIISFNRCDSNLLSAIFLCLEFLWHIWYLKVVMLLIAWRHVTTLNTSLTSVADVHQMTLYHWSSVSYFLAFHFSHVAASASSLHRLLNFTLMTLPRQWYVMSLMRRYKKCVFCCISFCTAFSVLSVLVESFFDFSYCFLFILRYCVSDELSSWRFLARKVRLCSSHVWSCSTDSSCFCLLLFWRSVSKRVLRFSEVSGLVSTNGITYTHLSILFIYLFT